MICTICSKCKAPQIIQYLSLNSQQKIIHCICTSSKEKSKLSPAYLKLIKPHQKEINMEQELSCININLNDVDNIDTIIDDQEEE